MTDGDKKVFKLYLVGAFGTDLAKACIFPPVHYFLPDLLLHKKKQAEENLHFSFSSYPAKYFSQGQEPFPTISQQ